MQSIGQDAGQVPARPASPMRGQAAWLAALMAMALIALVTFGSLLPGRF